MPFKVRLLALVKPVAMRFHKVTGHMSFRNETHGPSVRHSRGGLHYCPSSLLTPDYKLLISTWSRTALTLSLSHFSQPQFFVSHISAVTSWIQFLYIIWMLYYINICIGFSFVLYYRIQKI